MIHTNKFVLYLFSLLFFFQLSAKENDTKDPYEYKPFVGSINLITGEYFEAETDLCLSGPIPLLLKRMFIGQDLGKTDSSEWIFNHPYVLKSSVSEPKSSLESFQYKFNQNNTLKSIHAIGGENCYHEMSFHWSENEDCLTVKDSIGRTLQYHFIEEKSRYGVKKLISKVNYPDGTWVKYRYKLHPNERKYLITRKEFSDGKFLETEYYEGKYNQVGDQVIQINNPARDSRIGKVRLQKGPHGPNGETVILSKFIYEDKKTIVYNAINQKTIYFYNPSGNITQIDTFSTKEEGEGLKIRKKFYWSKSLDKNSFDKSEKLSYSTIENDKNRIHSAKSFSYDAFGNLIQEKEYGNFTGKTATPIIVDSKGNFKDNGIEVKVKTWSYSTPKEKLPTLLLEETDENGLTKKHRYENDSTRLSSTFLMKDNDIILRQFYSYNKDGLLIETITDDGKAEDKENISSSSERHIVKIIPNTQPNAFGMPKEILEYAYDFSTQEERLLKKTLCNYSALGELNWQGVYNAEGALLLETIKEFDPKGHLQRIVQTDGKEIVYAYDDEGHLLSETTAMNGSFHSEVKNYYNPSGKLIFQEEIDENNELISNAFSYDLLGRKIENIDTYGNKTHFVYDSLGHLIEVIHPEVLDENGSTAIPRVIHEYDISGNVISTKDPKGYKTISRYNSVGKPIEIMHPDNGKEFFGYDFSGSLILKIDRSGLKTLTERDFLGRPLKITELSQNGDEIQVKNLTYNAFHLIKEESKDETVDYVYDCFGRLIEEKKSLPTGERLLKMNFYDSFGRVIETIERSEKDEALFLRTTFELDKAGNIIKKLFFDQFGVLIKEEEIKKNIKSNPIISKKRNLLGQLTTETLHLDEKGFQELKTMDALGRIVEMTRRSPEGKNLEKVIYAYDLSGNKVLEEHHLGEDLSYTFSIRSEYGPCNRLESFTEESKKKSRKTSYIYNNFGKLRSIVKPDGITLEYTYNDKNELIALVSSDGTIDQSYEYDGSQRMTRLFDKASNAGAIRVYDTQGFLIQETLSSGFTLKNEYDSSGRRTKLSLFDGTSILYDYENLYLKNISRLDKQGNLLYSHGYSKYTLGGKLAEEILPADLGKRTYDEAADKLCKINAPFFSEEIQEADSTLVQKTKDPISCLTSTYCFDKNRQLTSDEGSHYSYDALGNLKETSKKTFHYNDLNELISDGTFKYEYDLNGNLIKIFNEYNSKVLTYDALDRLSSVTINGRDKFCYFYDPLSRRQKKVHQIFDGNSWTQVHEEYFLYDGLQDIGFSDAQGNIKELVVLGLSYSHEPIPIAIEQLNQIYIPFFDASGSLRTLVTLEKEIAQINSYSSFGERLCFDENQGSMESLTSIGFQGKRHEGETGFIYFGRRYYAPDIHRWIHLDPAGFQDGPNRYLFVKNDPLRNIDKGGLFSWGSFFSSIFSGIASCFSKLFQIGKEISSTIQTQTAYMQHIHPGVTTAFEKFLGKGFLSLTGFYEHPPECGNYGQGETSDKVRITLLNGISNIRSYFKESLELISRTHGGVNVHYIFRPTEGWCWDMIKAILIKFGYVSPYARALANTWKELIQEMGGVESCGIILHYCHSLGGADTATAANLLTPEERKMVRVVSFGSATMVSDSLGFESATNYISVRDGVAFFDPINWFKGATKKDKNVFFIGSFLGIPLIDHSLGSATYQSVIINLGSVFMKMYSYSENLL